MDKQERIAWATDTMHGGNVNRYARISDCGTYRLDQYTYHPDRGTCSGYWVGYVVQSGKRITTIEGLKYKDVKKAVQRWHDRYGTTVTIVAEKSRGQGW